MELGGIARHYLKTWFVLDLIIVGPDWVFLGLRYGLGLENSNSGNVNRLLRIVRMARLLRLLRLAKLRRVLAHIVDSIESESIFLMFRLGKYVIALVGLLHVLCSAWYLIGWNALVDSKSNWIDDRNLRHKPLFDRYINSFHWTIANIALGSPMMGPKNAVEFSFSVVVLALGMLIVCSLTAWITNQMMQLRSSHGETARRLWLLRRYLRQNKVPGDLFFRVMRFAEYACSNRDVSISLSEVTIVDCLSEHLNEELSYVVTFAGLGAHPLFEQMSLADEAIIHEVHGLASRAFSEAHLADQDWLFVEDVACTRMHIVVRGKLTYDRDDIEGRVVLPKDWLCEQALWVPWLSRGSAQVADIQCELLTVENESFAQQVQKDATLLCMVGGYARAMVEWLNSLDVQDHSDVFTSSGAWPSAVRFLAKTDTTGFTCLASRYALADACSTARFPDSLMLSSPRHAQNGDKNVVFSPPTTPTWPSPEPPNQVPVPL